MHEIIRSNDVVLLSFAESLMRDAGIAMMIADQSMSILEGSLGMLQRRLLVDADCIDQVRFTAGRHSGSRNRRWCGHSGS